MTDHAPVSDNGVLGVGAVHDRSVLDGRLGSHDDGPVVSAQDGSRPDGGLGTNADIANDHGVRVDKGRWIDRRGLVAERVESHGPIVTL